MLATCEDDQLFGAILDHPRSWSSHRLFPPTLSAERSALARDAMRNLGNNATATGFPLRSVVSVDFPVAMAEHDRARIHGCLELGQERPLSARTAVQLLLPQDAFADMAQLAADCMAVRRHDCPILSARPLKTTCRCPVCIEIAETFHPQMVLIAKRAQVDLEIVHGRLQKALRRLPAASRQIPCRMDVQQLRSQAILHKDLLGATGNKVLELGAATRDELHQNSKRVADARGMSQKQADALWGDLAAKGVVCPGRARVESASACLSGDAEGSLRDWLSQVASDNGVLMTQYLLWGKHPAWHHEVDIKLHLALPVFLNPFYFPNLGYEPSTSSQWDPFADPPPEPRRPHVHTQTQPLFRSNAEKLTLARLLREHGQSLVQVNRKLSQMLDLNPLVPRFTPAQMSYLRYCEVDFAIYSPAGRLIKVVEQQRGPHHDEPGYIEKDRLKRTALGLAGVEFEEAI